ncbi:hypothetical protein JW978_04450 [Candidatus Dojkabacteria bacterium]|nr:hypothetical protein [Candidatus Dojkabacteria bacterium]
MSFLTNETSSNKLLSIFLKITEPEREHAICRLLEYLYETKEKPVEGPPYNVINIGSGPNSKVEEELARDDTVLEEGEDFPINFISVDPFVEVPEEDREEVEHGLVDLEASELTRQIVAQSFAFGMENPPELPVILGKIDPIYKVFVDKLDNIRGYRLTPETIPLWKGKIKQYREANDFWEITSTSGRKISLPTKVHAVMSLWPSGRSLAEAAALGILLDIPTQGFIAKGDYGAEGNKTIKKYIGYSTE